jgi:proteasome assembly chaperone (PAC2) family protein
MSYLNLDQKPNAKFDHLIVAFAGWPDAGESATSSLKHMLRELKATKFAEIDPEEFYDFTQERPRSFRTRDGRRRVRWPANEFYYWLPTRPVPEGTSKGVLFFMGVEPNLKWRTFSETIANLALDLGVRTVVHMGALLDAVPHTREVKLTGSSTLPLLQEALESANIGSSNYQGPTGISTSVMETCTKKGMSYASLWGHTSHYLQAAPNYRVCYTLADTISRLLLLPVNLKELRSAADKFDEEVIEAIGKDEQLANYVKKLEDRYDESLADSPMPETADVVRELEQFLRSEQRRNFGGAN